MYAVPCLTAALATAVNVLLERPNPGPDRRHRGGADCLDAELGHVGLSGVEVSCDRGEDEVVAGRAGKASQQRELSWGMNGCGIARGRLGDTRLEALLSG